MTSRVRTPRKITLSWIDFDKGNKPVEKFNTDCDINDQYPTGEPIQGYYIFLTRANEFYLLKLETRQVLVQKKEESVKLFLFKESRGLVEQACGIPLPDIEEEHEEFYAVKAGKCMEDLTRFSQIYGRNLSQGKAVDKFNVACSKAFQPISCFDGSNIALNIIGWGYEIVWVDLCMSDKVIYNSSYDKFMHSEEVFKEVIKVARYKTGSSKSKIITVFETIDEYKYAFFTNDDQLCIFSARDLDDIWRELAKKNSKMLSEHEVKENTHINGVYEYIVTNYKRKQPKASKLSKALLAKFAEKSRKGCL